MRAFYAVIYPNDCATADAHLAAVGEEPAAPGSRDLRIASYRTEHGAEVDFIVETEREVWAIELKASRHVNKTDLRGLHSFADFLGKKHNSLVLYLGTERRRLEGIDVLPWQEGLQAMAL